MPSVVRLPDRPGDDVRHAHDLLGTARATVDPLRDANTPHGGPAFNPLARRHARFWCVAGAEHGPGLRTTTCTPRSPRHQPSLPVLRRYFT